MGCSASIQPDAAAQLPSFRSDALKTSVLSNSYKETVTSAGKPSDNTKISSFLNNKDQPTTPATAHTSPVDRTISLLPNGSETFVMAGLNDGPSTPDESVIEKEESTPNLARHRLSQEGLNKGSALSSKHSTLLRGKIQVETFNKIGADQDLPCQSGRRNSLGLDVPQQDLSGKEGKGFGIPSFQCEDQERDDVHLKTQKQDLLTPSTRADLAGGQSSVFSSYKKLSQIMRSQDSFPSGMVGQVTKEESEESSSFKRTELGEVKKEQNSQRDELKKHIQQKFTLNLVNLVLPKKVSPASDEVRQEEKKEKKQEEKKLEVTQEAKSTSPRKLKFQMKLIIPKDDAQTQDPNSKAGIPEDKKKNLDLSIDREMDKVEEDHEGGLKVMPHAPFKKSLFSQNLDDMIPTPPTNSGGFQFQVQPLKTEGYNRSSTSHISDDRKFKRSDTSVVETSFLDKTVTDKGQKRINQYIIDKELGRGSFGKVKLATHGETGKKYAIKIANKGKLKKKLLTKDKSLYSQLETEIAVMKKMDHPNIVQLFEVIDDPNSDKLYLVMEFVEKGAVMSNYYWNSETQMSYFKPISAFMRSNTYTTSAFNKALNDFRRSSLCHNKLKEKVVEEDSGEHEPRLLNEEKARSYFRDLILGLDYMHNYANVIHRDIKPENLLIDDYDTLKISDFNISCIMEGPDMKEGLMKNGAGTKTFLAPEAWAGKKHKGHPLDIWAAGATLYYFLYGKPPFVASTAQQLKELILNSEPEFPSHVVVSEDAINLIKACLKKNPDERATLEEIFQDKWLTQDGECPLSNQNAEKLVLTEDDIKSALTTRLKTTIMLAVRLKSRLVTARNSLKTKQTLDAIQLAGLIEEKIDSKMEQDSVDENES